MRVKTVATLILMTAALAGCNETVEDAFDPSTISNKVEQPLPARILSAMQAKGMDRNSPIMIRIFKEEGVLEIWKAKRDNRFDKIAEYEICAWSGKLGPKLKEGDRQAPEGFYPLSPAHLNPRSKYYLAINTGFPNRYDQANNRYGSNLMIHGACSSSGCYSMTDAQILEIYAFARDAFRGGQKSVQLQAFPFRMTAENMARHKHSQHYDFWQMLKVGYDNFEVTKRPPEIGVCDRKYVFNQMTANGAPINGGACPPMSTPPALEAALKSYQLAYAKDFTEAEEKFEGKVWYDPSEAERKALVADKRKAHDLAYAPTGSSLKAGRFMDIEDMQRQMEAAAAARSAPPAPAVSPRVTTTATAAAPTPPVPAANPRAVVEAPTTTEEKKPFWKIW